MLQRGADGREPRAHGGRAAGIEEAAFHVGVLRHEAWRWADSSAAPERAHSEKGEGQGVVGGQLLWHRMERKGARHLSRAAQRDAALFSEARARSAHPASDERTHRRGGRRAGARWRANAAGVFHRGRRGRQREHELRMGERLPSRQEPRDIHGEIRLGEAGGEESERAVSIPVFRGHGIRGGRPALSAGLADAIPAGKCGRHRRERREESRRMAPAAALSASGENGGSR